MTDRRKSWAELREEVRGVRRWLWGLSYRLPHSFAVRKKANGDYRLYFMSSPPNSKENSLYGVDIPKMAPPIQTNYPSPSLTYPWVQIAIPDVPGSDCSPSKEEELQMERKRMTPSGLGAYNLHSPSGKFLFNSSAFLYTCVDSDNKELPHVAEELPESLQHQGSPRLNSEMCPYNPSLVAYVLKGDIFVLGLFPDPVEVQLTFTGNTTCSAGLRAKTAGYPSYIIQEEFNRFQGFWWKPTSEDGIYQILYEEVDESEVGLVSLLTPPGSEREEYRFPTPGSPNAKSTLRIAEFRVQGNAFSGIHIKDFSYPLSNYFPEAEYLVRAGWTPDGHFVWTQLLDREQEYLQLVLIKSPNHRDGANKRTPPPYVIYNEVSSNWINVHDILEFFPYDENEDTVEFIWASEETGFRHLYRIKAVLCHPVLCVPQTAAQNENPPIRLTPILSRKIQLTSGRWEVINTPITVDFERRLIYFTGLMNSPLERHLYVVSLDEIKDGGPPQRLTSLGSSNTAVVCLEHNLVIVTYSNITTPPRCLLTRLVNTSENVSSYNDVRLQPIAYLHTTSTPNPDPQIPPPLILTHELSTGETLYAMVYRPVNFDASKKYPTILNIYGGPEVQLVYNSYKVSGSGQLWLHLLASQGYCIVCIDSRGSNHRGVEFESHIRRRMGTVEVQDQVEVLMGLSERLEFIDIERIGIYGWSYGGYLTLMGLVQFPKLFKVAVAGAPVTSWDLYDTGYTERYMGLPSTNASAYQRSSVLSYVHLFPDEENRLLIIHGLVDENVHFTHTAQLIHALVKAGKPHQLQVYPHERHSLRRLEASEHFETTLLSFLQRNL